MTDTEALTIEQVEALLAEQFPPVPAPEPFAGDPTATWTYWTDMDTAERGVPTEWVWERLRLRRDALLADTDWRMQVDASWDLTPWQTYRQALRDLPDVTTDPRQVVWPTPPVPTPGGPALAELAKVPTLEAAVDELIVAVLAP